MQKAIICFVVCFNLVLGGQVPCTWAAENVQQTASGHILSPNVPLGSYVYDYLEKLDGLGYLKDMRTGTKPYNRMQVAKWIVQIDKAMEADCDSPAFARQMLAQLKIDFSRELASIDGNSASSENIALKELNISPVYYHGKDLSQGTIKADLQPLNTNNNGHRFSEGTGGFASMRLEGKPSDHLVISMTPRIYFGKDDTDGGLEAGYVKTNINNLEIQIGKEPMWWGEGSRGTRSLSNNAEALTGIKLTTIDPIESGGLFKFLGQTNFTAFYSVLENNRSDIPYPSFIGLRGDFQPDANFTFALSRTDIVGGKGRMLSRSDWSDFITGHNRGMSDDKWDTQSGMDFRWRLPEMGGLQLYGEIYGEDGANILPSELSELAGIYLPRLSEDGTWDMQLEWSHTRDCWYRHSIYTDGWTYKNNIIGDSMGPNATRYYAKVTNFQDCGLQLSLNFERLLQNSSGSTGQKIDSVWLSAKDRIAEDLYLNGSVGVAHIANANFLPGSSQNNYMVTFGITKEYY